jgi:glycosyltransferase involved in cell wall biosynthesis
LDIQTGNEIKVSGMVVLSNAIDMCYPFIESIKSFLPVVDEMVVVWDYYSKDKTRELVEEINNSKIRIVPTTFDLEATGFLAYGIARTTGYQACKGDLVLMFDADGILHETDIPKLKQRIDEQLESINRPVAHWTKYRFYSPTKYWYQGKHSGVYNKKVLGDRFHFYRDNYRGAPNYKELKENEKHRQLDITLWGYEHVWDTLEVLQYRAIRYGKGIDRFSNKSIKKDSEYWDEYVKAFKRNMGEKGKTMAIEKHPQIIQDKLKSVDNTMFGYDFFNLI